MGSIEVPGVYTDVALVALALVALALCWQLVRALRKLDRIGQQVDHFARALAILTETSEVGFQSTAHEIARVVDAAARRGGRDARPRMTRLRTTGNSQPRIAAYGEPAEVTGLRVLMAEPPDEGLSELMTQHTASGLIADARGPEPTRRPSARRNLRSA